MEEMEGDGATEPSRDQLWEWLQETEDRLEQLVADFNILQARNKKLERKEYTREVLIASLRRDVRNQNALCDQANTIIDTLEADERIRTSIHSSYRAELQRTRAEHDALKQQLETLHKVDIPLLQEEKQRLSQQVREQTTHRQSSSSPSNSANDDRILPKTVASSEVMAQSVVQESPKQVSVSNEHSSETVHASEGLLGFLKVLSKM